MEREFGWLLDPVTRGDYPESLKQSIRDDLPAFTEQEKADLKGSIDFVGVNVYTARYCKTVPVSLTKGTTWQQTRLSRQSA
jgi:beta-glucosidase